MLDALTDKMTGAIRSIRGLSKLSESNVAEALKDVRSALLASDVHFKVAKDFIERVKNECLGEAVLKSVSPGQQMVKVIHDALTDLLGQGSSDISDERPLNILMVGLHGSGKTTSSVKLARRLKKQGAKPVLIACDVYRPAAMDQLAILGEQESIPVYVQRDHKDVVKIAKEGLAWSKDQDADVVIFDTAGRLQIDEELIEELKAVKAAVNPQETLLVGDSALGQEAVNVAKHFHEATPLTGIVLTKLDGDARGGAALSMKAMTSVPIKFIGTSEKMDGLEVFHPERMAQRILGMGDVVSLVEKAQENIDQEEAKRLAGRLQRAEFDFEDFLAQLRQMQKLGNLGSIAKMIPGMGKMQVGEKEEKQLKHTEALILSMTHQERQNPKLLNGRRRMRIAAGAGLEVRHLNMLLKQFAQMQKMMKMMKKGGKGKGMQDKMRQMGSMLGGR